MIFRSIAGFLLGFAVCSFGKALPIDPSVFSKSMAVLNLVNLRGNRADSGSAEGLRQGLKHAGFHVIPRDETEKNLNDFGASLNRPCNNVQCGFDAGGFLQSDFVLYGTYTPIEKIRAVTLKLLYVPSAQVVWTWVGELPILDATVEGDSGLWRAPVEALAEAARSGEIELRPIRESRSLVVLDVSENFYSSRIISERVQTRMMGLTHYQPMSDSELSGLLGALGINKFALGPSPRNMTGLGQQLGASALLYARAYREGDHYLCRLAFYDVEHKTTVLDFPAQPTRDFGKILEYEDDFFATLATKEKGFGRFRESGGVLDSAQVTSKKATSPGGSVALWISLGLLGIGGGLTAFWLESLKKK